MDGPTKRVVTKIAIGTLAVCFILWMTTSDPENSINELPSYSVNAQTVTYAKHPKMTTIYGKTTPLDPLHVDAEVSAKISDIFINNGQSISKGDVLLTLDRTEYEIKKADLSQRLLKCDNQINNYMDEITALDALIDHDANLLKNAQDLLIRYESLSPRFKSQQGLIERQDSVNTRAKSLEQNQSNKRTLLNLIDELAITKKQINIQLIDNSIDIDNCTIYAEKDGVISQLDHEIGDYVQKGHQLFIIIDPKNIYIHAFMPIQYFSSLHNGLSARLRDSKNTPLTLDAYDSHIQENAVHIDSQFHFTAEHPDFPVGQVVTLAVEIPLTTESFLVPESAIYEQHYVYLIQNNLLQKKDVTIVGTYYKNQEVFYLVYSDDIKDGMTVLTSHLPWPKSGQSVTYAQ